MQLDLIHLLRIARRWWWVVLLACLIGGASAYTVSDRQQRLYTADATLLVSSAVSNTTSYGSIQAGQSLTETYKTWATSRPILQRASEELGYSEGIDQLESRVTAENIPGTLFIRISATDPDPERAAEIANTVASTFIEDVRTQSVSQSSETKESVDAQIESASEQLARLNTAIDALENQEAPLTDPQQTQLDAMTSQRSQLEQELLQLQTTATTLSMDLATSGSQVSLSVPAIAPSSPSSPQVVRTTLLGTSAGLAIGAAAILLLEYFDKRLRTPEDLAQITSAPVLATVNRLSAISKDRDQLFVLRKPTSIPSESMRLLRENLQFASAPNAFTSLVITSPGPSEGKSTIVANLGVVMAQAGLRTIIIDADLRRPTQHKIFGVSNERGLSSFLANGHLDRTEATVRLNIPGLSLIPSGPIPPNPADILRIPRMDQLLRACENDADIVLIDTSPILLASDALSVASRSDATVVICRLGETQRDQLSRAIAALDQASIPALGMVLNDQKESPEDYDYYQHAPATNQQPAPYYYGADPSAIPYLKPRHPSTQLEVVSTLDREA